MANNNAPIWAGTLEAGHASGFSLKNNIDDQILSNDSVGSLRVVSNGQPLAAIAPVAKEDPADPSVYGFSAGIGEFGHTVILPRAAKNAGGRSTSYLVMNPNGTTVTVTETFYNEDGTTAKSPPSSSYTLNGNGSDGRNQALDGGLSNGWQGSIVLEATQPIVVIMREVHGGAVGAYNGALR
ncbi:MAG: hypothetical protein R2873_04970 [Caldilineaceae bacterium]